MYVPVQANAGDFLDFLKKPNTLFEVLQPGSTTGHTLAPAKDQPHVTALQAALRTQDWPATALHAGKLGFYNHKRYRNTEALDFFLQSYNAATKTSDPQLVISCGLQVAFIQKSIGAWQSANEVLAELKPALDKLNDPECNGIVYTLMGDNYGYLNELAACTESFRRAARYFSSARKPSAAAICHLLLGENELRLEEYIAAQTSFHSAIRLTGDTYLRSILYRDLGLVHFKKRDFENAIGDLKRSDQLVPNHLVKKLLKESYMQLFTLYSYRNEFDKADGYHNLYRQLKKELESTTLKQLPAEREQIIRILQLKREQLDSSDIAGQQLELSRMIDQRDMDLQLKEQELAKKTSEADSLSVRTAEQELVLSRKEAQISRFQNTRNMLIAFSVITVLLLILFYNRYALKKKSGEILARSNAELQGTLEQLRSTQDQLIHSEKMAGLGKLTAGIAHEIQNPLNFVRNFSESGVELLEEYKAARDEKEKEALIAEMEDALGRIKHHAARADQIVKSMLQHSRAGGTKMEATDVNNLLQDSVQLAYHSMRATLSDFHCRIEEHFEPLPDIQVLPQQISRVFLNLSNNAFYAMYEYARAAAGPYEPLLRISSELAGDKVRITLEDNGPGIPKENLQRIFEPFYTTKPSGKGTGLGLSISYDVVRQHGGELLAESSPGNGARFIVLLPLNQPEDKPEW